MKRTHGSTWRMKYTYFKCVLHNIILNIFIIVIIGCPIFNCMIHYNVCNDKSKYCAILCASGNYCGSGNPTSPPGYWL